MPIASKIYNTFFKRNSVFVSTIFVGTFAFGIGFDVGINNFWDRWNKGKQWKDIKPLYVKSDEE